MNNHNLFYQISKLLTRHENPRSPLIFRNGERLKNSTLHAKENYRIMEQIQGFTDEKTRRKSWIFRTHNIGKRL